MSLIFALLLAGYASIRLLGWARGQMRWRALRSQIIPPLPSRPRLDGCPEPVDHLHRQLDELRFEIGRRELAVRRAAATDPDADFGVVRSGQYRTAVRRLSWDLDRWLAQYRRQPSVQGERGTQAFDALRCDDEAFDRLSRGLDWLRDEAANIAAARALEAFRLERVESAARVMAGCRDAMHAWQLSLERSACLPYRRESCAADPLGNNLRVHPTTA